MGMQLIFKYFVNFHFPCQVRKSVRTSKEHPSTQTPPFSQVVPQICPHNLWLSTDVLCLQSVVPPYQLLSAVAVLPCDLPHQRSLRTVTV